MTKAEQFHACMKRGLYVVIALKSKHGNCSGCDSVKWPSLSILGTWVSLFTVKQEIDSELGQLTKRLANCGGPKWVSGWSGLEDARKHSTLQTTGDKLRDVSKISYFGYKSTMYLVSVLRRINSGMDFQYGITSTCYRTTCQLGLGGHLNWTFDFYHDTRYPSSS